MTTEERRLAVLRAIVEDYVATHEPVGSKALVDRHRLGVSPATVRNDMAVLEDEGLIVQPHTSAGRIPTDKGYRFFVDRLTRIKPMSVAERRAIARFLDGAHDVDDVVQRSVRLLAQLTHQVAIVQYPTLARSQVRHIELVPLSTHRLLTVLILSNGRIEQRVIEVPAELDETELHDLRARINATAENRTVDEAAAALADLAAQTDTAGWIDVATCAAVIGGLVEAMASHRSEERVVVGGTANLARFGDSFETTIRPVLEALEEHVVLLRLLGEATSTNVSVSIGHEGPFDELAATSVVSAGYGSGDRPDAAMLGALGVVGPTRMDYPGTMAAVRAVAAYVSSILEEN